DGAHTGEQVGHARHVGDDVVAVEADDRQQLVHDLDVLDDDEQEQRLPPGEEVEAHRPDDHHDVEVDAAQIGAQPAPPVQAVGVGDIGVERRPGQVQAAAHASGLGAAVSAAGRMPHLVE